MYAPCLIPADLNRTAFIGVIAVNIKSITGVLLALGLTGCGSEELVELPPPLLPVKTILVSENGYGVRTFPGRVEASQRAELSFRVPGKLVKIHVAEGESIAPGRYYRRVGPHRLRNWV